MTSQSQKDEQEETVLIWNLQKGRHDTMRLVLVMAGYGVRNVYDESDAINMVGILSQTNQKAVCLLIKCAGGIEKISGALANLEESEFSIPILLILPSAQPRMVDAMRSHIPQGLDVRFCLSDNTLDALTGIAG